MMSGASAPRPSLGEWRTASDAGGYTRLYFTHGSRTAHAFIVKAVETGFVLCLPAEAIDELELEQAKADQYPGFLGPFTKVSLRAITQNGKEINKSWPCLLVDMHSSSAMSKLTDVLPDVVDVLPFGMYRLQTSWIHAPAALQALEEFINGADLPVESLDRLEGYFTATSEVEAEPVAAAAPSSGAESVLQQLLDQSFAQRLRRSTACALAWTPSTRSKPACYSWKPQAPPLQRRHPNMRTHNSRHGPRSFSPKVSKPRSPRLS